jgi:hypothetical protein
MASCTVGHSFDGFFDDGLSCRLQLRDQCGEGFGAVAAVPQLGAARL